MKSDICLLMIAIVVIATGCASRVRGVAYQEPIIVMCVENNPAVTVPGFERDLESQLLSRGIMVDVIAQYAECPHPFLLRYVARRSLGTVTLVTLDLYRDKKKVAFVDWDAGRGATPPKISDEVYHSVEYWQLAEALGALFGDFKME